MALCSGERHGTAALQKSSCRGREVILKDLIFKNRVCLDWHQKSPNTISLFCFLGRGPFDGDHVQMCVLLIFPR